MSTKWLIRLAGWPLLLLAAVPAAAQQPVLPFKPPAHIRVQLVCDPGDSICEHNYGVKPGEKWWQPLVVPHRTADRTFWLSTGISLAATAADCENTIYALRLPGAVEANPLLGKHPGRARCYGISMPFAAVNIYETWHYKRESDAIRAAGMRDHKWRKWPLPNAVNTAEHLAGVFITLASTGR